MQHVSITSPPALRGGMNSDAKRNHSVGISGLVAKLHIIYLIRWCQAAGDLWFNGRLDFARTCQLSNQAVFMFNCGSHELIMMMKKKLIA